MDNTQPIIVKRVKKVAGGHHGGAWKIAFADFATAMMAFFLVMWLMSSATPEQKKLISGYFQDPIGFTESASPHVIDLGGTPTPSPDRTLNPELEPAQSEAQIDAQQAETFAEQIERERLESKKISKTQAVTSNLSHDLGARNVHIGPSDYVSWLDDRKWAYVRPEGRAFGDVPLNLEYKLEVWDSPNSAGIIIDAIRAAKIAKDRGIGGPILSASSYFMKSPPVQHNDDEARELVEAFIRGDIER